jgi:hypothetical protein
MKSKSPKKKLARPKRILRLPDGNNPSFTVSCCDVDSCTSGGTKTRAPQSDSVEDFQCVFEPSLLRPVLPARRLGTAGG